MNCKTHYEMNSKGDLAATFKNELILGFIFNSQNMMNINDSLKNELIFFSPQHDHPLTKGNALYAKSCYAGLHKKFVVTWLHINN